jgi:hypothetical protein
MTAAEWEASNDPTTMLTAAGNRIPDPALMLFVCGAARRVHHLLPEFAKPLVPRIEAAADLPPAERELAVRDAFESITGPESVVRLVFRLDQPLVAAQHIASALRWLENRPAGPQTMLSRALSVFWALPLVQRPHPEQAAILRCVAGNPFAEPEFDPAWRTSTVLALARTADADHTFENYPVLADALQDAGCSDEAMLNHLRGDATHVRGCHVLGRILNRT